MDVFVKNMNYNSDLSSSQDDLDLPLKDEFPNSPPTNCNNFCPLSTLDRDSSDTFISCSPPDTPSKCLTSSPAPNQSPSSHVMPDSPALPIPSSPEPSWQEQQPSDYEVESCQQQRHSPTLPPPPSYQYSISQNRSESPSSVPVHPATRRLSPTATEFHCPSVSLIPEPLPLTEKTPLLSGDRPSDEIHQSTCSPSLLPKALSGNTHGNPSSSQYLDDSFTLRLSPSNPKPFYSLSPKSVLSSDCKSPLVVPSPSSPSLLPDLMGNDDDDSPSATGTGLDSDAAIQDTSIMEEEEVSERKDVQLLDSVDHDNDTKPSTSTSSCSNKPLPDPAQGTPCIVDLTGDDDSPDGDMDDDEVEIVSSDQPVVFLGRETVSSTSSSSSASRRNRKRKRHDSSRAVEETIIIHEDPPAVLAETPSSSTTNTTTIINVVDSPEGSGTDDANPNSSSTTTISYRINNNNNSINSNTTGIFEMSDSSRVFGDLLNSPVIPLDNHNSSLSSLPNESLSSSSSSSSSYCTCSVATTNEGINSGTRRVCNVHQHIRPINLLPHLPLPRCGSREERRQSSITPQPLVIPHGQSLDAPIPQDVINDIESLLNENARGASSYIRNFFMRPSGSGASGSSSDFVRSAFHRSSGLLSRHTTQLPPSSVEVDIRPSSTFHTSMSQDSTSCVRTASSSSISSISSASSAKGSSLDVSDDSGGLSCPICFESFQDIKTAGRNLSSTVCGHIFCTACLEASLKQTKQCPTCRKRLRKKQYHPLYI